MKRFLKLLEANPILTGAFGVAVCLLLILSIASFQYVDHTSVAVVTNPEEVAVTSGSDSGLIALTHPASGAFSA